MPPRRRRRSSHLPAGPGRRSWLLLLVLLAVLAGGLWYLLREPDLPPSGRSAAPSPEDREGEVAPEEIPPRVPIAEAEPPAEREPAEPAPARTVGHVALIVDDLGRSLEEIEAVAALGIPVSYSVLPFESRTGAVVDELARRGVEILCHLPMEGTDGKDPGRGALALEMGPRRLEEATREALDRVPPAVGVNNHMGSALTANDAAMRVVLGVLARRGLFFVDSRTSPDTVAFRLARELGIPAAERDLFLDTERDPAAIEAAFDEVLALSTREGVAIAIGHPYPETLEVLSRRVPEAKAEGFTFVPASFLLERTGVPAE